MGNPDRIRERMEEQKDSEQTIWVGRYILTYLMSPAYIEQRIEPLGWDSDDQTYFVLDDNRLYRRTDPPPPPVPVAKPKKNSKKAKAALRASKRRKISEPVESEQEAEPDQDDAAESKIEPEDDGFGGMTWECIAITLNEYNTFIDSLQKSRDPNEKILRKRVIEDVLPLLEKQEEARKRKAAQKEKELLNIEKLAHAKRSSRIRDKAEHQKQEEETREAERKKQADLIMAKKEQDKWQKLEKERESRMQTREQRLKEREARRILHEEELATLSEDSKKLENGSASGRLSERHLKAEIERKKQALEELTEEEDWIFDCICGAYGQIDDGTHSIACDKCNIWQHSKCVGVKEADADHPDFNFICTTCKRKAEDEKRAKTQPPIKIKINRPGSSSSAQPKNPYAPPILPPSKTGSVPLQLQNSSQPSPAKKSMPQLASWQTRGVPSPKFNANGQPQSQQPSTGITTLNGSAHQRVAPFSPPRQPNPFSSNSNITTPQQSFTQPNSAHVFSSPHPQSPTNLAPPSQSKSYTFVNGNGQYSHHGVQSNAAYLANGTTHTTPYNPPYQASGHNGDHRRSSITMPSPLGNAPNLSPVNVQKTPIPAPQKSSSPSTSFSAAIAPIASSPVPILNPTSRSSPPQPQPSSSDPSQSSDLPPSSMGMSPTKQSPPRSSMSTPSFVPQATPSAAPNATFSMSPIKHSPPRPTTAGSSFGSVVATPVMAAFQPMTSLSPNAQVQNLSPPVKHVNTANGSSHPSS